MSSLTDFGNLVLKIIVLFLIALAIIWILTEPPKKAEGKSLSWEDLPDRTLVQGTYQGDGYVELTTPTFPGNYLYENVTRAKINEEGYLTWWLTRSRDVVCDNDFQEKEGATINCWIVVTSRPPEPVQDNEECGVGDEDICPVVVPPGYWKFYPY